MTKKLIIILFAILFALPSMAGPSKNPKQANKIRVAKNKSTTHKTKAQVKRNQPKQVDPVKLANIEPMDDFHRQEYNTNSLQKLAKAWK